MRPHRTDRTVAPTLYPLSQAELESHCRATGAGDVDVLPYLLAAAEHIETICDRALLTQAHKAYLDAFPCGDTITLPLGWLQSVTHIKYYASDDTETTIASTQYYVDAGGDGRGRIVLKYGNTWPSVTLRTVNPIEVQFVCGKISSDLLPQQIRHAIRLLGAAWYENREEIVIGTNAAVVSSRLAVGVEALVANWRLW